MTGPLLLLRALWSGPWGIGTGLRRFWHWLDGESPGAIIIICLFGVGIGFLCLVGIGILIWWALLHLALAA